MKTKKVAPKKAAKKSVKKVVKKASVKKSVKKTAKKVATKPIKKVAAPKQSASPEQIVVKPVTDTTGVVTMRSIDEADESEKESDTKVVAVLDKETGVITMVTKDR